MMLLGILVFYLLQKTPELEVSEPSPIRVLPAAEQTVVFIGAHEIPNICRTLTTSPWNRVLDQGLYELLAARGLFPETVSKVDRRILNLLSDEAALCLSENDQIAVVQLGVLGRIGFNLLRWTTPWRERLVGAVYGRTPGLALVDQNEKPLLHVAMRGPYLFVSNNEESLARNLAIAEGSRNVTSFESQFRPLPLEEPASGIVVARVGPNRSPRVLTAEIDARGARFRLHYVIQEDLPTLSPAALLEPSSTVPKSAGLFVSSVWPPTVMSGFSKRAGQIRDSTAEWLTARTGNDGLDVQNRIQGPVTFASADWVEVPGYLPFPNLLLTATTDEPNLARDALDRVLQVVLHPGLVRREGTDSIRYQNDAYLSTLSPSMAVAGDQLLLTSTEAYLEDSLGAVEGRVPTIIDRPGFADLEQYSGSEPAAALFYASGDHVAKLGSDLILALASKVPPTAADDTRDLLVPVVESLKHFRHIYGRLGTEDVSGTSVGIARVEMRLEPSGK
jgi:hypothetical protein